MMYDSILARSFSKHEQKRLGYGAFLCCLFLALCFCTVLKPSLNPLPALNLQRSLGVRNKILALLESNQETNIYEHAEYKNVSLVHHLDEVEGNKLERKDESFADSVATSPISSNGDDEVAEDSTQEQKDESIVDTSVTTSPVSSSSYSKDEVEDSKQEVKIESLADTSVTSTTSHISSSSYGEDEAEDSKKEAKIESVADTSATITSPISSEDDHETKTVEVLTKETIVERFVCNVNQPRTEYCEINGDARVEGKSFSVIVATSQVQLGMSSEGNSSWTIGTYARKEDGTAMSHSTKWLVKQASSDALDTPKCSRTHNVPAVLFSSGGYTGNHFHDFTDVVIPLFISSRKYKGEVQFLVTDTRQFWVEKFKAILKGLSNYEFIDIDKEQEVHCFPSITVGLIRHEKELSINDPSKYSHTMKDFREFLRETYSLNKDNAIRLKDGQHRKPRLLIIPRKRTRSFTNTGEIMRMARRLGYKVSVAEGTSEVAKFAQLVNACDVLMGVHGAGLTNILFLPDNAVAIQILPIGGFDWLANEDFGKPSWDMNINYLDYKISNEESTLIEQYPLDHAVFTDPYSIGKQGWEAFKSIFLDKQNVRLDVERFKPTLVKALELLHH